MIVRNKSVGVFDHEEGLSIWLCEAGKWKGMRGGRWAHTKPFLRDRQPASGEKLGADNSVFQEDALGKAILGPGDPEDVGKSRAEVTGKEVR